MFLLACPLKWQGLAGLGPILRFSLRISTKTGIVHLTGVREYPRTTSEYTIRTPSPDGQHDVNAFLLPVFFRRIFFSRKILSAGNKVGSGAFYQDVHENGGTERCFSRNLYWRLRLVPGLPPVVTLWANRLWGVLQSAQGLQSLLTTALPKGRPSAPQVTWPTVSFTHHSVTDTRPTRQHRHSKPCGPRLHGFLRRARAFLNFQTCQRKTSHVQ